MAVATADGYRRKGYARTCLGALCRELTGEGKSLVLFYHNKAAGRLYSSLGFKDIGGWSRGILKAADF